MDTAEAMIWGREWTFGTNKHPYLSGWIAELFRLGCGENAHLAAALLPAFCTTLAMYFAYRLALRFVDRPRAVQSAMLLEGCIYFNVCGLEYNCNMLSIALMPLFFWLFHLAVHGRALRWIPAGAVAGLLIVTKYTNGVFLFAAFAYYLIALRRRRVSAPVSGPILALVPFAVILMPHVMFLTDTDFTVLSYFAGRSAISTKWYGHIVHPLVFFCAQVPACWLTVALLFGSVVACRHPRPAGRLKIIPADAVPASGEDRAFLFLAALCPVVLMTLISAIGSVQMKSMWGAALLGLIPLLAVSCFSLPRLGVRPLAALAAVLPLTMVIVQLAHTSFRTWADYDELAKIAQSEWTREYGDRDIPFVGGHVSVAAPIALALPGRPSVFQSMDPVRNPWLSESEIRRCGVLVVDDNPALIEEYRERFPKICGCREFPFVAKAPLGKAKRRTFYVGWLPPERSGD